MVSTRPHRRCPFVSCWVYRLLSMSRQYVSQYVVMIGCYAGDSYSRLAKTLNSTFVGIFCSKLTTMIECIAVVQSVRNTQLPTSQFTFMVKFPHQGQIFLFHYFDLSLARSHKGVNQSSWNLAQGTGQGLSFARQIHSWSAKGRVGIKAPQSPKFHKNCGFSVEFLLPSAALATGCLWCFEPWR